MEAPRALKDVEDEEEEQHDKIIKDALPLVDDLLESYRCHLKYLRRSTLTALLCCSPLPFDLFEKKVSKTVQLFLRPLEKDELCSG